MQLTDKEFDEISTFVRSRYGINLTDKKKMLVATRLNFIFDKYDVKSYGDYFEMMRNDMAGDLTVEFLNRITTNHTFVNREAHHFEFMKSEVLPYIEKFEYGSKDLRIWSAGCSNGAEAYSIAMTVEDYLGTQKRFWDTTILATDISMDILHKAKEGAFPEEDLKTAPDEWIRKYFDKGVGDHYVVKKRLRDEVLFRRLNLMNQFPFRKKFHLIFCRNVMIYFDNDFKHQLAAKFYDQLEDGGYLFIGHSETLDRNKTNFEYVKPAIYRKGCK
ncbi:MAG: protein-glutamate O-methyltransferase CheR [Clostridia bacterium]|nr:protein-glutamate O-methyltransferase CheR [Clostridia bacterium]